MEANEIEVGKFYMAKTSNGSIPVRVDQIFYVSTADYPIRYWKCTNMVTDRKIKITGPEKFDRQVPGTTRDDVIEVYKDYEIRYEPDSFIPTKFSYQYCHKEYNGPDPDPKQSDHRCGRADSVAACKEAIDDLED